MIRVIMKIGDIVQFNFKYRGTSGQEYDGSLRGPVLKIERASDGSSERIITIKRFDDVGVRIKESLIKLVISKKK